MRTAADVLINTDRIELWPANLLRARSNRDARALSRARYVLRRKRDGCYLAADLREGLLPLVPGFRSEEGIDAALAALDAIPSHRRSGVEHVGTLPLQYLQSRLAAFDLNQDDYRRRTDLVLVCEPDWLAPAGFDRYRRPLWLHVSAARAWQHMRAAALLENVVLEAISGYRSHDYQFGIFERKLAQGQKLADILTVNAAPGFSEHHSGLALDISTPDEPAAEESFQATAAFAWLRDNAAGYGFNMSYPRDNPHGIVYEPWHWAHASD